MFSEQGTGDTQLSVGRYLESVGSSVTVNGDVFRFVDGARVVGVGSGPFARLAGGSVTISGNFLTLSNNTDQPTLGNGHAPSVSLGGTFLELSAESPARFVLDADGAVVGLVSNGLPAPSMTLGGSLVSARNATISAGDRTSNTILFAFVGDGSTLRTTGSAPLLVFDGSSVDAAGGVLAVTRSPSATVPSTLTLGGPLFVATNGSTFNTTSLRQGPGALCCAMFQVSEGARLEGPQSSAALIQADGSTFVTRGA